MWQNSTSLPRLIEYETRVLSPEAQLLLACARRAADREAVRRCVLAVSAWDAVLTLAEAHGVAPLVASQLSANASDLVPVDTLAAFNTARHRCAMRNFAMLNELVRVTSALRGAAVEAISYKGPLVARDLYGDFSLRESADLDLIIRRNDFARVRDVLANAGYRSAQVLDRRVEEARLSNEGQCQFLYGDFSLDIHCRAFQPYLWPALNTKTCFPRARETKIGSGTALVLGDDDLIFTLVLHGTKHGWSRLIWLCDVAELLRRQPDNCAKLLEYADYAHALRAARLALLLCNRLLGVPLSAEIECNIHRDREMERLYAWAIQEIWVPTPSSRWKFLLAVQDSGWRRLQSAMRFAVTPTIREFEAFGTRRALAPIRSLARASDVLATVAWRRLRGFAASAPPTSEACQPRASASRSVTTTPR
jgi:hypothetical protein